MSELMQQCESLRLAALEKVRAGDIDQALNIYDAALAAADSEETRELITINKADAMITDLRTGPEVQALAAIVMRRRSLRHVYLASYALVFKYRTENELKRAVFYGQLALRSAEEADNALWKACALNELGVLYEMDSKFGTAIEYFEQALDLLAFVNQPAEEAVSRVVFTSNLAGSMILNGATGEGLKMMHSVIDNITLQHARSDAYLELCYGYLDLQDYETAKHYGEAALNIAVEPRQIRNAHYLLGEVAYKADDVELAEYHFDELAKFYPDFRHLKSVLFAIDLRSLINLRL